MRTEWTAVKRRVAIVGTELAPLEASSGALERAALGWAADLRRSGLDVVLVDAGPTGPPDAAMGAARANIVLLNNRPLWAEGLGLPVVHVLHNYPDAWGTEARDRARVADVLGRGAVAAVSPALARDVGETYAPRAGVGVVRGEVEECFFREEWRGGGPVLFPNRLLEKKGVRFFLELSRALAADGLGCALFRHLAPWKSPTPEHASLLEAVGSCPSVEMFEPPATRAEMAAWYARAAVVLCPSVVPEGLGMVALEAQAVGAPLVTSGRGGLADATLPPNEVVHDLDVEQWRGAVHRAVAGDAPPPSAAAAAVALLHGPGAATESLLALFAFGSLDGSEAATPSGPEGPRPGGS